MKKVMNIKQPKNVLTTWKEALQTFLYWKKAQGLSQRTLKDYEDHVTRFFNRYPSAWQDESLQQCILEYMSDSIKPATYNIRLIYLNAFFQWCIREAYLVFNPLQAFKKRKADPHIVNIDEDVLKKLLSLPDQSSFSGLRDYSLILLSLDTGVRPLEAISLKMSDFDLRHLVVTIPAEIAKTRSARTLPILPPTAAAINRLMQVRPPSWGKDVPLFSTCHGTLLTRHTWNDRLEIYSKILGTKIRPYDLRHCFALMYLRGGGNAFGLQKTLGHCDISMTKRYVSLTGQDLQDIHNTASPINKLVAKRSTRIRKIKGKDAK